MGIKYTWFDQILKNALLQVCIIFPNSSPEQNNGHKWLSSNNVCALVVILLCFGHVDKHPCYRFSCETGQTETAKTPLIKICNCYLVYSE